jgi:hypothetical protein
VKDAEIDKVERELRAEVKRRHKEADDYEVKVEDLLKLLRSLRVPD